MRENETEGERDVFVLTVAAALSWKRLLIGQPGAPLCEGSITRETSSCCLCACFPPCQGYF